MWVSGCVRVRVRAVVWVWVSGVRVRVRAVVWVWVRVWRGVVRVCKCERGV